MTTIEWTHAAHQPAEHYAKYTESVAGHGGLPPWGGHTQHTSHEAYCTKNDPNYILSYCPTTTHHHRYQGGQALLHTITAARVGRHMKIRVTPASSRQQYSCTRTAPPASSQQHCRCSLRHSSFCKMHAHCKSLYTQTDQLLLVHQKHWLQAADTKTHWLQAADGMIAA
jgi:hypothetical protein